MRKLLVFFIVAAFLIGNSSSTFAANQAKRLDSSSLSNSNTLINNIEAGSVLPVGTVITWPSGVGPQGWSADINNTDWLECNGSPIPAHYTELIGIVGANTPNYAGMFLRGRGGKAGALGVKQEAAVHVPSSVGAKLSIKNITDGAFVETVDLNPGYGAENSNIIEYRVPFRPSLKQNLTYWTGETAHPKGTVTLDGSYGGTYHVAPNAIGVSNGSSYDTTFTVDSPAQETRPDNVAVIYYIKAR